MNEGYSTIFLLFMILLVGAMWIVPNNTYVLSDNESYSLSAKTTIETIMSNNIPVAATKIIASPIIVNNSKSINITDSYYTIMGSNYSKTCQFSAPCVYRGNAKIKVENITFDPTKYEDGSNNTMMLFFVWLVAFLGFAMAGLSR